MASRVGSTLINRGPSPKPPATPSRVPQQPAKGPQDHALDKIIDSLIIAVVETIKGTEWPEDSKDAAEGLTDALEHSPEIPNTTEKIPQSIRDLIEQYAQVLEDVHTRLKDASSKTGIKNWKIYQNLRSIASKRPIKCKLLFQTYQDDVVQVVNSLRERMDSERSKETGSASFGTVPKELVQPRASSAQELSVPFGDTQSNPTGQVIVPPSSTPTPSPLLSGVEDEGSRGPIRVEGLNIARKTFKAVEIASGSIPVAGTFVAAAAGKRFRQALRAGPMLRLDLMGLFQTMDKNDDLAKDLGAQTAKLSKLLARVTDQPKGNHGELIADHITDLHNEVTETRIRELSGTLDKVTRWKSLGLFNKALHSRDHSETLTSYQGTVQKALEELQVVSLDTRRMTHELRDVQVQEQKRRLLDRLGDGKYGAQGNAIKDVICFPGTRVEILKRINNWIGDVSAPERVLWIRGMAGRGKSTIASTVVHDWRCRASCAIFHFRRGQSTVNTRFLCTLARQLGSSLVPEVKDAILDTVRENSDVANQRLEEQFETLFVAPLSKLNSQGHPIIIIVDALDECDNPKDAVDFVRLIDRHCSLLPVNLKFLLTCRPEAPLVRALEPKKWRLEDLDKMADVSDDLERFIEQAFKQMRDSDPRLPKDWPSSEDVRTLVEMSQGLFQWARTAITYVGDGSPVNRLRALLKRPSMWGQLDGLYHQILSKAFDSVRLDPTRQDLLRRVLGTLIVTTQSPQTTKDPDEA
ncbi:hypothetical protein FS837_002785 [Tulasnella sp. UAMH 9824]|nr:hypothetical protein FS837_002785 [Tulasnella sp. UAMH 9824]